MGNFSVSHYAGIVISQNSIEIRYILDMAEIPTFQEIQQTGIVPQAGGAGVDAYVARKAELLKAGLHLDVDGQPLLLRVVSQDVIFPPGAGGLPTMKLGFVCRAVLPGDSLHGPGHLYYRDDNFATRAGWKEIVAVAGSGASLISSSVPAASRSAQLGNYPTDMLNSPPQDLEARVSFRATGGLAEAKSGGSSPPLQDSGEPADAASHRAARANQTRSESGEGARSSQAIMPHGRAPSRESRTPGSKVQAAKNASRVTATQTQSPSAALRLQANIQGTPRSRFTELVTSQQWGFWFLLTAALIAAGLGGLHALEPGHGKTIVAAYLVGSQGTASHAMLLGLVVTLTHTAGVYLLGLVTLYASEYVVPDRLYPWLGVLSGFTIAGLGSYLFLRRRAGRSHSHDHNHGPGHAHDHARLHEHHDHANPGAAHGASREYPHVPGEPEHHSHEPAGAPGTSVSCRQLLALGVTGGIVPCPAALVVLLSAISLHRVGFGLFLIAAFSVGLAAVLITIGLLTVYTRRLMTRLKGDGPLFSRWLPATSAAIITVLGIGITVQALVTAGIVQVRL